MRNIFLLYMPPGNAEAMLHYRDTIQNRVPMERLARFLSRDQVERLREVFGNRPRLCENALDEASGRLRQQRPRSRSTLGFRLKGLRPTP